nr:MAG TPA: hypothetical protein [Caudoviricetes sp.]
MISETGKPSCSAEGTKKPRQSAWISRCFSSICLLFRNTMLITVDQVVNIGSVRLRIITANLTNGLHNSKLLSICLFYTLYTEKLQM